jgi:hypothetical protein
MVAPPVSRCSFLFSQAGIKYPVPAAIAGVVYLLGKVGSRGLQSLHRNYSNDASQQKILPSFQLSAS